MMRFLLLLTMLFCFTIAKADSGQIQETAATPRAEYPRPDFQRDNWLNLNGTWAFAFDPDQLGLEQKWFDPHSTAFQKSILVPFAWQSALSGIAEPSQNTVAWYRRTF